MSYGKKIKQAQKRGNTARAERLQAKQDKRKSKRVTLYTPGKNNGSVKIGRQKFNKLATMDGNFGADSGEKRFYRTKSGAPLNGTGSFYTADQNAALKTLRKKLGFDDFSGGNLGKAQRAINFSNPTVVQQAAPVQQTSGGQQSTTTSFDNRIAGIQKEYASSLSSLTDQLTSQQADFAARESDFNSQMNNLSNTLSSQTSLYNPTDKMGTSYNINPAMTSQETSGTLKKGTQRYNRNSLSINNVNV